MTVLELIQSTTAYFDRNGVESPRLNIEHLLAHVLGCRRLDLYLQFDRPLSPKDLEPLRDLVRRRANGEPLQHLLGTTEFCGREFACDARALVPRPETEQLVELVLGLAAAARRVLDVGTGSGVIALTLAERIPGAAIEAVDISPGALALAEANAARRGLAGRVVFRHGDMLESAAGEFDLIVANLPYIARGVIPTLAREVQHDPVLALDGGDDGLDLIRRLAAAAPAHLAAGGLLALEIGHDQAERVSGLLREQNHSRIEIHRDYQGRDRFITARHG